MKSSTLDILRQRNLRVGLCGGGITKVAGLESFLKLNNSRFDRAYRAGEFDLYIGWGNKPSGQKAVEFSEKTGQPFLLLEDAFLRSVQPQSVGGEKALGLVLDDEGIYYDASRPSRLEWLIKNAYKLQSSESGGAQVIEFLKRHSLSKYNSFSDLDESFPSSIKQGGVLVVDQTFQDHSVSGAGADEKSFVRLLEAAIDENPGERIIVKLHPEVLAGKKQGYLKDTASRYGCVLLAGNINPWRIFDHVEKIYTVSSQLGFDALMAGRKVRCFGMPFYAGWGLTTDEGVCKRRSSHSPSIETLARAAYRDYANYIDAYDGSPCDVLATARQIVQIRDAFLQNTRLAAFYQITPWKWGRIRKMFTPPSRTKLFYSTKAGAISAARKKANGLVVWASRIDDNLANECKEQGVQLYRLEDGFIRSVGLGANFNLPMSLILDDLGIYYDPRQVSRLEHILQNQNFSDELLSRAKTLTKMLVDKGISKYNLQGEEELLELPDDRRVILVPGQVDDDASIIVGGNGMSSTDLLKQVRKLNPDAFIIFKPHPDVVSGLRSGLSHRSMALQFADHFAVNMPINELLEISSEVHTISSLTGFEALLRGKKVTCYGLPFYAGWGLTKDFQFCDRRRRKLQLYELVAATLIIYPRYYDPASNLPCGPELIIRRIEEERKSPTSPTLSIRLRRGYGQLKKAWRRE